MPFSNLRLFTAVILLSLLSSTSFADLLISPTRVVLDDRTRSATITLINSGDQKRSYRISWKQLLALPKGGYRPLTDTEKERVSTLDRIIRISPKQVNLNPGERQSIKLLLRKSKTMPSGEYRSHLTLTALPIAPQDHNQNNNGATFQLNMLVSYTLPIMYRVGPVNVSQTLSSLSLITKKETGITFIKAKFSHNNRYSTSGRLVAIWQPTSGKARQVGLLNNYNIYPETRNVEVEFPWHDFTLEPGTLTVRYEGQQEFKGTVFSQKTLVITPKMIQSVR